MKECFGKWYFYNERIYDYNVFNPLLVFEGESIYEVIRVLHSVPLFLEDHLKRLHHTFDIKKKKFIHSDKEITEAVHRVIRENKITEGNLKIVLNFDKRSRKPVHFLVYWIEHFYPVHEQYAKGVRCILHQAERPLPSAKIINQGLRITIYNKLIETGMYEAILVNNRGYMTEGSRSNVFFIKNNLLYTAPDALVLAGISRSYVIKICSEKKIPLRMEAIHMDDLPAIEAVFLTGTSIKILPVSTIGNNHFATNHPVMQQLMNEYDHKIESYINGYQ